MRSDLLSQDCPHSELQVNSIAFCETTIDIEKRPEIPPVSSPCGPKPSPLFIRVTRITGSNAFFFLVMAILLVWVIVGIILKGPTNWQVVMNDGSSIQVYITNMLLIHQQVYNNHKLLTSAANLRCRGQSAQEMLLALRNCSTTNSVVKSDNNPKAPIIEIPTEHSFHDRVHNWILVTIGSFYGMIIYWIGIIIWLAFGLAFNGVIFGSLLSTLPRLSSSHLPQCFYKTLAIAIWNTWSLMLTSSRDQMSKSLNACSLSPAPSLEAL